MSDDVKEIKQDIKEIRSCVGRIEVVSEKNTVVLDQHMKRTALNEERIMRLEYWLLGILASCLVALIVRSFLQ